MDVDVHTDELDFGEDITYDDELEQALQEAESQLAAPVSELEVTQTRLGEISTSTSREIVVDIEDSALALPEDDRTSPFAQFRKKGFLSVSDLVGPIWCETQSSTRQADKTTKLGVANAPRSRLRTLPFLPPEKRPDTIVSTAGKEIVVDKIKVEGKERILKRGEKIHKRLEREIHPEEVAVKANTREDVWGLRFLNMLSAVEALLSLNKCREMPVVGFVNGVMIMGIISLQDEVTREPVDPGSSGPATRSSRSTQTSLTSFFSSTKPRSSEPDAKNKTHRLYISDSKTRASGTVPREEDTLSGRLQVMMYKELLDAILLAKSMPEESKLSMLPSRNGFSWDAVFAHLSLDSTAVFSDDFIAQSRAVIYGNGLKHGAVDARTLNEMKVVWDKYVVDLGLGHSGPGQKGKSAKGKDGDGENVGRTEDRLQLVYRRAEGKKKARKDGERRSKRRRRRTKVEDERETKEAQGEPPPSSLPLTPATSSASGSLPNSSQVLQGAVIDFTTMEDEEERLVRIAIMESLKEPPAPGSSASSPPQDVTTVSQLEGTDHLQPHSSVQALSIRSPPDPVVESEDQPARPPTRQSERYWASKTSDEEREEDELAFAVELSLNPDLERGEVEALGPGEEGGEVMLRASQGLGHGEHPMVDGAPDDNLNKPEGGPGNGTRKSTGSTNAAGSIIGTTTFRHSPLLLAAHLQSVLGFWMGEREPTGVSLEDTRRCGWCEFEEGCEWRAKKAEEIWKSRRM